DRRAGLHVELPRRVLGRAEHRRRAGWLFLRARHPRRCPRNRASARRGTARRAPRLAAGRLRRGHRATRAADAQAARGRRVTHLLALVSDPLDLVRLGAELARRPGVKEVRAYVRDGVPKLAHRLPEATSFGGMLEIVGDDFRLPGATYRVEERRLK